MRARFADCVLDAERRELTRRGERVEITPKAFALLEQLVRAHPSAVSKEALYDALWPGVFVETGNLHTLIAEIRSAIGDDARQLIRTVHRFGYALAADVLSGEIAIASLVIGDRDVPLHDGENIITRELIGAPDVSRRHARIIVRGGTLQIEDLGSKNGTWVGGKRVDSAQLRDGDEVIIGRTRALIRIGQTDATMTAPPLTGSRE